MLPVVRGLYTVGCSEPHLDNAKCVGVEQIQSGSRVVSYLTVYESCIIAHSIPADAGKRLRVVDEDGEVRRGAQL